MQSPEQTRRARRGSGRERIPQLKLTDCRVSDSAGRAGYRVILEGDPLFIGALPPQIDIAGQTPTHLAYSRDGRVAAGFIPSAPQGEEAMIDYGFSHDRVRVRSAGLRDRVLHWRVITAADPRSGIGIRLERLAAWLVARLLLIPH